MRQSNYPTVATELLEYLKFGFDEFIYSGISLSEVRKYMVNYVQELQKREKEQILDAFLTGAEYSNKAPEQLESLANLYYNLRFPNKNGGT